jgi:beta-galactosidase
MTNRSTVLASGKLQIPSVLPAATEELLVPEDLDNYKNNEEEVWLTISFKLKENTKWATTDHEIAWFQHRLSAGKKAAPAVSSVASSKDMKISDSRTKVEVAGSGWSFTFDRVRGFLTSWKTEQGDILEVDKATKAAILPSFWRAPTDNDKDSAAGEWKKYWLHRMTSQLRSFEVQKTDGQEGVVITAKTYMAPPVLGWGYHVSTVYTISAEGALGVKVHLKPTGLYPKDIPRLGINLRLSQRLDQASWFGLGPGESYPDKKTAQRIGIWSSSVDGLEVPYDVPQDNGNRMETRWARLCNSEGNGVKVTRLDDATFSWTGGRLTSETIENAKHPCDLVREDATLLNLSSKVAGVGSASCGPGVREDLLVKVEEEEFEFLFEKL